MTKKFTLLLMLVALLSATMRVSAVTAVPWPVEKTQPDGTKISVYLCGDEKVHWMESLEGYTLMYDANRFIVYADKDGKGNLVPSKVKFGQSSSPQNLQKKLRYSEAQVNTLKQIWQISDTQQKAQTTGNVKVLAVLAAFSNRALVHTQAEFDALMNQAGYSAGGATGSVRDYYYENSYNQMTMEVTVAGPVTLSNTTAYYATRQREFANEVVNLVDPSLDFSQFANSDGLVETFHIIFAGYGDEAIDNGQQIWSHAWSLGSSYVQKDGVSLYRYSCSPELRGASGSNITYIGVIAHELGHVFGSPDYYDTTYSGYPGTGNWDLMAGGSWNDGGRTPAHINPYQKIQYGWITPVVPTAGTSITDMPASANQPVIYKVQANGDGEHYLLENKQLTGFDAALPGHGLLIWHAAANVASSRPNDTHPQQFYPVYAASTIAIPTSTASSYGAINSTGCPFPGSSGKTSFSDGSVPMAFSWATMQGIHKPISNIREADGKISFDYIMVTDDPVENLQATVSGASVTLTWDAPSNSEAVGYKIYRDGALIYSIGSRATVSYTQINVVNGAHTYGVAAIYPEVESEVEEVTVTVTGGSSDVCLPVTDLKATAASDKVSLSWKAPFSGGWISIAGNYYTAYQLGLEWESFQGTLWEPSDLTGCDGYDISKIRFIPREIATGVTYAVEIYEVPATGDPVLKYSQPITPGVSDGNTAYVEYTLAAPYSIDASKGIIVGTRIHTMGGGYLTVDNSGSYPGRNIFFDEDGWYALEDIGVPLGQNYCLGAYLSDGSGAPRFLQVPVLKSLTAQTPFNPDFLSKNTKQSKVSGKFKKVETDLQNAPAQIVKYLIYRDGVQIDETTETSWQDVAVSQETTYSYCVAVAYDNSCTSETACVEATTPRPANPFRPVGNLKAKAGLNDVGLQWDVPYYFTGGPIGYSGSTIYNAYRGNMDFSMAARFTTEDLSEMEDMQLKEVTFGTYTSAAAGVNPSTVAYTIRVWTGGGESGPATLVYEQAVPTYSMGWNTVVLDNPVDIDITQELWIGLRAQKLGEDAGVYPATVDAGPAVVGKGDMVYIDGAWTSWTAYTGSANYNWTILGLVGYDDANGAPSAVLSNISYETAKTAVSASSFEKVSATGLAKDAPLATLAPELVPPTPLSYKISRDGTQIAQVTETAYTDNTVDIKTQYNYCVTAVYSSPDLAETDVYMQDFEDNTTFTNILTADVDGDGQKWGYYNAASYAHSGSKLFISFSWNSTALTPDNWLIFSGLNLTDNNQLEYFVRSLDASYAAEHYGVYISTHPVAYLSDLDYFEPLFEETMTAAPANQVKGERAAFDLDRPDLAPGSWKQRTVDLSAYAGQTVYIAFRHYGCTDEYALALEDVRIYEPALGYSDPSCISVETEDPYKPVETLSAKVVASDVTLAWTVLGEGGGARTALLEEGFDGGSSAPLPTGWTSVDSDGDGYNWYQLNTSDNSSLIPHGGEGFATSASYQSVALYPDNWLISPAVTLTDDNELEYYVGAQDADWAAEHYGVYISTTDPNPSSFTLLTEETLTAASGYKVEGGSQTKGLFRKPDAPEYAQGNWYRRTVDLSAYAGQTVYIAFRHFNCNDWFRLNLDDVSITAPASAGGAGSYIPVFDVYADGVQVAQGISEQTFSLEDVPAGLHTYCVKAIYNAGAIVTAEKCKTVGVVALGDAHRPVSNLTATSVEHEGTLVWETPRLAEKLSYHNFESGTFSNIGTNSAADFDIAIRFTPEDLKKVEGLLLTKVRFIPVYDISTTAYSVRVWQGGDWENRNAGSMIVDQPVESQTAKEWAEIALDVPVSIDASRELWIGIRCNTLSGYPAPMQMPGAVEGKGNLMYFQGSWSTASELGSTLTGNWIIDGIAAYHQGLDAAPVALSSLKDAENRISTGALSAIRSVVDAIEKTLPVLPEAVAYEISRDGETLATTTELTYIDNVPASGTYSYEVKAVYDDGVLSTPESIDITYISDCDNAPENVRTVRSANRVNVAWDYTHVVFPGETTTDVLLAEDFNSGLPVTWTTVDADGDGECWFQEDDAAGDGYMTSESWSFTTYEPTFPDHWLITPQVTLKEGSVLTYTVYSQPMFPAEHYGIFVSTTNTSLSSFTSIFEETLTDPAEGVAVPEFVKAFGVERPQLNYAGYQQRTIDLSAYAGQTVYIAFRHFDCTDQFWITIDDVKVEAPKGEKPVSFNVYINDEKVAENIDVKEFEATLTERGRYTFGVSYTSAAGCESEITYSDSIDFKVISFTPEVTDKIYDGNVAATVSNITFDGLDAGDELVVDADYTIVSAVFADRNAGSDKTVSVTLDFDNFASQYYMAEKTAEATADIIAKAIIVKGLKANNKVYDATTDVVVSGFATLNGKIGGDEVYLSGDLSFEFSDADVAADIPVTISGLGIEGLHSGNYSLELPELKANITPALLTVAANGYYEKTYGDADPEFEYTVLFGQLFGDDTLEGSLGREAGEDTGQYGINRGTLSGGNNYTLNWFSVQSAVLAITPATLTVTPDAGQKKATGKADPVLTYTVGGWKFDDENAGLISGALAREAGEDEGSYAILKGDLSVAGGNYIIDLTNETFQIFNRDITAIDETVASSLKVSPNPVKAGVPFTVVNDCDAVINVFTLNGQLIEQKETSGAKAEITIARQGIFLIRAGQKTVKVEVR
jgi:M6 family metalloprotease-like protein